MVNPGGRNFEKASSDVGFDRPNTHVRILSFVKFAVYFSTGLNDRTDFSQNVSYVCPHHSHSSIYTLPTCLTTPHSQTHISFFLSLAHKNTQRTVIKRLPLHRHRFLSHTHTLNTEKNGT